MSSAVESVAAVSGSSRAAAAYAVNAAVTRAKNVSFARAATPSAAAPPVQTTSSAGNTVSTTPAGVSLGVMLSVTRPGSSNTQANADYSDLETDLRSGNLAAAQQAYSRLQSDLLMFSSPPAASGNGFTGVA